MKVKSLLPDVVRRTRTESDNPFYMLQKEVNSLFDSFFRGFDVAPRKFAADFGDFTPSVDVKENDKEFIIKAELPGVEEKDVEVTVTNDSVMIKGEKKKRRKIKTKTTIIWKDLTVHSVVLFLWKQKLRPIKLKHGSRTEFWKLKFRRARQRKLKEPKFLLKQVNEIWKTCRTLAGAAGFLLSFNYIPRPKQSYRGEVWQYLPHPDLIHHRIGEFQPF